MYFTVFYAWQNDSPPNKNRYLIRDALRKAVKRIKSDLSVEEAPRLDQDTAGVPGTPGIADTILDKIERCGVFVCDLTLVASVDGADPPKYSPNPNVLFELGYAAGHVGWERIIGVLNEEKCSPDDLPFDLRHRRWPIRYRPENKGALTKELERAIRSIIESGLIPPPPVASNSEWYVDLLNVLIDVHISASEYPDRIINPWADALKDRCKEAASEFTRFKVAIDANLEFADDLERLTEFCDELVETFRHAHLGSGPQQADKARAVAEAADTLFRKIVMIASFSADAGTAIRSRFEEILAELSGIVARLSKYEGRIEDLKSDVSTLGGEALRLSYFPVTTITQDTRLAIAREAQALHLIDTHRIFCDGGVSVDRLFENVTSHVEALTKLLK